MRPPKRARQRKSRLRFEERRAPSIVEGQSHRVVEVVRKVKLQKPIERIAHMPARSAVAVAGAFGDVRKPLIERSHFREKVIARQVERFRWMKPDGKGGFVPK